MATAPIPAPAKPLLEPASLLVAGLAWGAFFILVHRLAQQAGPLDPWQLDAVRRAAAGALFAAAGLHWGLSRRVSLTGPLAVMGVVADLVLVVQLLR